MKSINQCYAPNWMTYSTSISMVKIQFLKSIKDLIEIELEEIPWESVQENELTNLNPHTIGKVENKLK